MSINISDFVKLTAALGAIVTAYAIAYHYATPDGYCIPMMLPV